MRTISFITPQSNTGLARVLTTHQTVAFVQSETTGQEKNAQIKALYHEITAIPPHTRERAEQITGEYAKALDCSILAHAEGIVTLASCGTGIVFLKRNNKLTELVSGGSCAQGPVHNGDEFILTTSEFLDVVGGLEGLSYYFLKYPSTEVVEMMKTYEDHTTACGFAVIGFGNVVSVPEDTHEQVSVEPPASIKSEYPEEAIEKDAETQGSEVGGMSESDVEMLPKTRRFSTILQTAFSSSRTRKILLIGLPTVFLLYLALTNIDSVGTPSKQKVAYIQTVETAVDMRLKQAETEAFVNLGGVETLIIEAREQLGAMTESEQQTYKSQVSEMNLRINAKEKELLRISNETPTEYFDVSVDAKNAQIRDVDSNGINLYLLDGTQGVVYVVDGKTRAYTTLRSDKLKGAVAVTATEQFVYVLTAQDGIYLLGEDSSIQVIKPESDWGSITDIKAYTGNIYVLDSKRKNIFKYSGVDEKTFGTATSYLVEELQGTLSSNKRFTVDGSVYASGDSQIVKFTTGRKGDFNMMIPYKEIRITSLYSDPDLEKVYVFDGEHNALLELTKEGIFERQWKLDDTAIGIGANIERKTVFLVTKQKIYEVKL